MSDGMSDIVVPGRRQTMTLGEYRVGINFNPGGSKVVDQIKRAAANLIDLIAEEIDPHNDEVSRLKALAITHIEDGAMWAVKAATKPPR